MMLKKKSWSVDEISRQIHALSREMNSPYNEGFTAFGCKQDLYQIKWLLDSVFKDSPNFGSIEQEWLTEQEKSRIIKHLKS
jgi:hypothetical protein